MSSPVATPEAMSAVATAGRTRRRSFSVAPGPLARLVDRPANVWLAMLAVNALFLPYRSRFHDALLYGFQVQNAAEHGRFRDDLFLRYGSQDGYSIFSLVAAPMARAIGLQPALFLLYLLATALFFLAAARLVRRLVPNRTDAAAGLLLFAVSQPIVGSLDAIHVNENFLTARLPAEALVLFGLERLVAGHPVAALLLQFAALTVHPLMAFGGLMVSLVWCVLRYVPRRHFLPLAGAGAVFAMTGWLLARGAGMLLLAPTDPTWLREVALTSPYMFLDEWLARDWGMILVALLVLAWARARLSPDRAVTDLCAAVLAVTAMAIAGSVVVRLAPFALILQGQPFRALWLLQALAIPLALPMARDLWSRGGGSWRAAAVVLLWCVGCGSVTSSAGAVVLILPGVAAWCRGLGRTPRDRGWLWRSLAISLAADVLLKLAFDLTISGRMRTVYAGLLDPSTLAYMPLTAVPAAVRAMLGVAILAVLSRLVRSGLAFRLAALTLFIAAQIAWYRSQAPGPDGTWARADGAAVRFLRTYLEDRGTVGVRPPTVYWPCGHVDLLWHDLGVNSYYAWYQLAGNVFRRETAIEGRRRGELVRPFEVQMGRRRRLLESLAIPSCAERTFGAGLKGDSPGLADVLRLCADEAVDYAVLRQGYSGWYSAHDGDWFIYDARAIRARARSAGIEPPVLAR